MRSSSGEDAAICRDPGATWIDTPREIELSEMAGGDPVDFAGGAGGKAPRGIHRSEMAGGDPVDFPGGAGGKAPRGINRLEPGAGLLIAPRWTDPRGMPAVSPSPGTARGSVRALGSRDGSVTLPGVAVVTERRSEPQLAEPAVPAVPAWPAAPAAPPRPSAEMMLAPSLPTVPLIRAVGGSRPVLPAPPSSAALLICAALIAGVASFLLATLLSP
jgi:hypothetical protein